MSNELKQHSMVEVVEREGISAVWIVPLIALLFGAWLLFKMISDRGIYITVQFENANGIVVGKTEVKYKGLTVGVVRDVDVSEDLQSVLVEIEMIDASEDTLTDQSLFWYVTADISFQGVTGLDTLLSGSYIKFQPDVEGAGQPQREFVALKEEPELDIATPGLHLKLTANELGSIAKNSPVSFKQMTVGYVSGHQYDEQMGMMNIHVFIEPEYAHLVKESSRFWNVSGFEITGSITSGVTLNTESLASIVSGGIAFGNLPFEEEKQPAKNGQSYSLYRDYSHAEMGHEIKLILGWNSNIDIGAPIVYQGLTIGRVESFEKIDPESQQIIAKVRMNPRVARYLTTETQFYLQSPELDLGGVTNLNQLFTGAHIGVRPSQEGELINEFTVYGVKPAYKYSEAGVHLVLKATHVDSLKPGSGLYYEQQDVGSVQAIESKGPNDFLVHVHIKPEYQHYITTESRFWNISGLKISGSIQHFDIQAQSLQAMLKGGVAFDSGISSERNTPANGSVFQLHINQDVAKERTTFTLLVPSAKGLNVGMRIMHRGEKIGSVHHIERHQGQVMVRAGLLPEFESALRVDSQFWLAKANLSLSGLNDTDALLGGAYFGVNIGQGAPATRFNASLAPPKKSPQSAGLQLTLLAHSAVVANSGSPISYKGIVVGQVDHLALTDDAKQVAIDVTIEEAYQHLINDYTRFYSASGVTITGSLSQLVVKTESVDSVLTGGISFYNAEETGNKSRVNEGAQFTLYENVALAQAAGKAITIYFNEISGLTNNMPIKYKGQTIGLIERLIFEDETFRAKAVAYLNDAGKKFAVDGTKFWLAEAQIGLVGTKNIDAFIEGYINALPGTGGEQTSFEAQDMPPAITALPYGLNIVLSSTRLGSVRVGDPVLYRQVKVGSVIGLDLAPTANAVNIFINIASKYANLVQADSKFWNASGMRVEAGLFSGVTVESESLEAILAGGVAFATPESSKAQAPINNGHRFILLQDAKKEWHEWAPTIHLIQE